MSDEQDVERGRLAQSVLDNPVYAESYAKVEQGLTAVWRASRDAGEREEVHQLLRMLDKVRGLLEQTMRDGKLAQDNIIQKQNMLQRAASRFRPA